jgi:hypothetical protein
MAFGHQQDDRRVHVQLAGLQASVTSRFSPFMDYAENHLAPLRIRPEEHPYIEASLAWHEHGPPRDRLAAYPWLRDMERIDRDLYRNETGLGWFRIDDLPSLHLRFTWDGERLRVHGDFFFHLSDDRRRDWLKRLVYHRRLPDLRRRRFTTLLYYLLYYPCFWWLERKRDLHPIHGGGVHLPDGVVVLAGPSGVGKSTLVTGLATAPATRLLSDTFLLHSGTNVRPVPEPLLLDKWSQGWLGRHSAMMTGLNHRYCLARDGFHWKDERRSAGGTIRLLLFPHRATTHYVHPLSSVHARGRLRAGDLIVNDLRRYWAYASALELLDPSPLVHAREENLALLVESLPIYEVGITPEITPAGVIAMIEKLIQIPFPDARPLRTSA